MTIDDIQLARELVALDCWEWPVAERSARIPDVVLDIRTGELGGLLDSGRNPSTIRLPDITHPITKGWLKDLAARLQLELGAGSDLFIAPVLTGDGVMYVPQLIHVGDDGVQYIGSIYTDGPDEMVTAKKTEHAALVAAIKAGVEG